MQNSVNVMFMCGLVNEKVLRRTEKKKMKAMGSILYM